MSELKSAVSKESMWRNHLARHADSGKSVSKFCRDEAISESNFYAWRARLCFDPASTPSRLQKKTSPFIDLGLVKDSSSQAPLAPPNMELRIDLGGGVLLTIVRR